MYLMPLNCTFENDYRVLCTALLHTPADLRCQAQPFYTRNSGLKHWVRALYVAPNEQVKLDEAGRKREIKVFF